MPTPVVRRVVKKSAVPRPQHDDDESPRPRMGAPTTTRRPREDEDSGSDNGDGPARPKSVVRKGWSGAKAVQEASSQFAEELKITDDPQLIKFLDDEPFASYRQHWIERSGKKSFVCREKAGCALCDLGDKPSGKYCFNVAVLTEDGEHEVKVWVAGSRDLGMLEKKASNERTGPLTKLYWSVYKGGDKGGSKSTSCDPVKERDLSEDWPGFVAVDDDLWDKLQKQKYDESMVQIPSAQYLKDIAKEVSSEE